MSVLALLCRSRFCVAVGVFNLLSLGFLVPAHAQQPPPSHIWQITYAHGDSTGKDTTRYAYTPQGGTSAPVSGSWPAGSNGYSVADYGDINSSVGGTVTATLTWVPATGKTTATDPPSEPVYITEAVNASEQSNWSPGGTPPAGGSVDDGLGDATVVSGTSTVYKTAKGVHLLVQDGSSGTIVLPGVKISATSPTSTITNHSPDWINSWVNVSLTVAVTTWTLNLNLTGTTLDSNNVDNILIGQGCTANLLPTGCTISAPYQWSVSGTTFQDWEATTPANPNATPPTQANPNASYELDGSGPLTNATAHWFWNDLLKSPNTATETVSCTATVTPTNQSPLQVTVSKPVIVQVPQFIAIAIGGYMQVNMAKPDDTTHNNLWAGPTAYEKATDHFKAGMNWQATLTTPSTLAFGLGKLQLVQLVSTNSSGATLANPTVTLPDANNPYPKSLDNTYPYGYDVASEMPPPALTYADNDSPSMQLDGTPVLATANKQSSYYDYLMYMPPVAKGSTSMWVLLSTFNWTVGTMNGSVSIPAGNNWSLYANQHGGSDYAGPVTPPGPNPPQNSAPTPIPFTAPTGPNTFPKWTHIDLN